MRRSPQKDRAVSLVGARNNDVHHSRSRPCAYLAQAIPQIVTEISHEESRTTQPVHISQPEPASPRVLSPAALSASAYPTIICITPSALERNRKIPKCEITGLFDNQLPIQSTHWIKTLWRSSRSCGKSVSLVAVPPILPPLYSQGTFRKSCDRLDLPSSNNQARTSACAACPGFDLNDGDCPEKEVRPCLPCAGDRTPRCCVACLP